MQSYRGVPTLIVAVYFCAYDHGSMDFRRRLIIVHVADSDSVAGFEKHRILALNDRVLTHARRDYYPAVLPLFAVTLLAARN